MNVKPLFIVKPGTITREDIDRAEKEAGVCIIECTDPDAARFLEPPLNANMDVKARAALKVMNWMAEGSGTQVDRAAVLSWFVKLIMQEPPAPVPSVKKGPAKK